MIVKQLYRQWTKHKIQTKEGFSVGMHRYGGSQIYVIYCHYESHVKLIVIYIYIYLSIKS
jgi:hypothetical protein